jgi:hypothetical protein
MIAHRRKTPLVLTTNYKTLLGRDNRTLPHSYSTLRNRYMPSSSAQPSTNYRMRALTYPASLGTTLIISTGKTKVPRLAL